MSNLVEKSNTMIQMSKKVIWFFLCHWGRATGDVDECHWGRR